MPRCRFKDCQETTASTSGNLYRHERNAHGMHGGRNSYLCPYSNCKKSREGNGFNERNKLKDHIRRHSQKPYLAPNHIAAPLQTNLDLVESGSDSRLATGTLVWPFECNGRYDPGILQLPMHVEC